MQEIFHFNRGRGFFQTEHWQRKDVHENVLQIEVTGNLLNAYFKEVLKTIP